MSRFERTGVRDLTYSAWHRTLGDELTMIDIDGIEYCRECGAPLALIETARDAGQTWKATAIMRRLAACAGLPAFLVFYEAQAGELAAFRVRQVSPVWAEEHSMAPAEYATLLRDLRAGHTCTRPAAHPVRLRDRLSAAEAHTRETRLFRRERSRRRIAARSRAVEVPDLDSG